MYPERVKAFADQIQDDVQYRSKIDKKRFMKVDSKGGETYIKFHKIDKTDEKATTELVNVLFTHLNIPDGASNLKYYLVNIAR